MTFTPQDQETFLNGWKAGYFAAARHVSNKSEAANMEGVKFLQRFSVQVFTFHLAEVHKDSAAAYGVVITHDGLNKVVDYVARTQGDELTIIETALAKCGQEQVRK